jgi:hypothetical protein
MERKRGVCPIVPNQSFDDEAFISARASEPRQSKIPATIPELTIEMTIAMLPRMAALHPMRQCGARRDSIAMIIVN